MTGLLAICLRVTCDAMFEMLAIEVKHAEIFTRYTVISQPISTNLRWRGGHNSRTHVVSGLLAICLRVTCHATFEMLVMACNRKLNMLKFSLAIF